MAKGYFGQQLLFDDHSDHNVIAFIIRQALGKVRTGVPAQVIAVHGGGVGAPPTVDCQPLINMTDGQGNQVQHGTVLNLAVLRLQGGPNAIIIDPQVGDIGWLLVGDRDTSALRSSKKRANPGSFRRFNLADAVYFGGFLNPANPTQYVQFTTTGVKIVDLNGNIIEMKADGVDITATKVTINGDLAVTGSITAGAGGGDSVTLQHHLHPANNTPPTPGT